jgi:titin
VSNFSDTGLQPDTAYFYRVRALTPQLESDYSEVGRGLTRLTMPANLTAQFISASEIQLDWTDTSSSETGFIIKRSCLDCTFVSQLYTNREFESGPNTTQFIDTDVLLLALYTNHVDYQIQAVSSTNSSLFTSLTTLTF